MDKTNKLVHLLYVSINILKAIEYIKTKKPKEKNVSKKGKK